MDGGIDEKCLDGSSEIKEAEDGHCDGEEVMCTARDGRFAGKKICVEKKFQCDNYLQCEDGTDEKDCKTEYKRRGIFKRDHDFICTSLFLYTINETNQTDKFFPMRAIRCITVLLLAIISINIRIIILHIILNNNIILILIIIILTRCDTIPQCPNGEDEEGCTIPESVRLIMGLIIVIVITTIV